MLSVREAQVDCLEMAGMRAAGWPVSTVTRLVRGVGGTLSVSQRQSASNESDRNRRQTFIETEIPGRS